jgi:hypothetical protein
MTTKVKVRPDYGPIKEMDIEELDALYTKPIDSRVKRAIEELRQAMKSTVKTGIEWAMVMRALDQGLCWNDEDEDDERPFNDGTWKAWHRHRHKTVRVKALRAAEEAKRAAKAVSATAA